MSVGQPDEQYTIGVDYGTLSGRAVVVRVSDGAEVGSAVHPYPHAVVDEVLPGTGAALPPDWALQVPEDYREVLRVAVPAAVAAAGIDPGRVIGIATDFTACTMVPTLADGTPLNELPELAGRPHAYVKLWKHHAAQAHADRINRLAEERGESWLPRYGGLISSEWEFAKGLQLFEEDREVYDRMERWVEAADWIVWQLTDVYVRNACTAGYKGIRQDGAYPSRDYLAAHDARAVVTRIDHPGAVDESGRLAERLRFDLTRDLGYSYPGAEDDGADRDLVALAPIDHQGDGGGHPAAVAGGGVLRIRQARPELDLADRGHVERIHAVLRQGFDHPRRRVRLNSVEDVALKTILEPARRYRHRIRSRKGDGTLR